MSPLAVVAPPSERREAVRWRHPAAAVETIRTPDDVISGRHILRRPLVEVEAALQIGRDGGPGAARGVAGEGGPGPWAAAVFPLACATPPLGLGPEQHEAVEEELEELEDGHDGGPEPQPHGAPYVGQELAPVPHKLESQP